MRFGAVAAILLMAGCGGGGDKLLPLSSGKVWQYQVTSGLTSAVQEIKVDGPASVGPYQGWKLSSASGESRLAWYQDKLFASELSGTVYRPPLPLVDPSATDEKPVSWAGVVDAGYGAKPAKASVFNKKDKELVGNRSLEVTLVDVKFSSGDEALVWLAPGLGVVRQEQRRGDRLVAKLVYLSGP